MLRKLCLMASAITLAAHVSGQESTTSENKEEKGKATFSGFADAYFRSDFMSTPANNRTSFTNTHNSFELGMASMKVDYTKGKVSMTADVGIGKRAQEFSYNETGLTSAIKQLYISYQANDWLKLTAGSWATHVGYELVDAPANRNYSMSYMFSWGPFFHTGVKAEVTTGNSGFMFGIANPTDFKTAPINSSKYVLAQYSVALSDDVKAYVNYVGGKRYTDSAKTGQFDLVLTAKASDLFSLGFNGTVASNRFQQNNKYDDKSTKWWGSALYLNLDPTPGFGITLRSEYFSDKNSLAAMATASEGAAVFANTLSGNIRVGGLTLIPEFRVESASGKIYSNKNGAAGSSDASFLIAAVYKF
jgi:hypothetical protein